MKGQRFRLKDGAVVTVVAITGGSILGQTAEGNPRYFTNTDIDHQIGGEKSSESQNSASKPSEE